MKLEIEKVDIVGIDRKQALELKNELLSIPDGCITFKKDKYPRLHELYQLISNAFDSSHNGIHFIKEAK